MNENARFTANPLNGLPLEVTLSIVGELSDLCALGSLLEADPATRRRLDKQGLLAEIVDNIMATTLPDTVAHTLRVCAMLRSHSSISLPFLGNSLDSFVCNHLGNFNIHRNGPRPDYDQPIVSLQEVPSTVLRALLQTFRQSVKLTEACLSHLLRMASSMSVRHLDDIPFSYRRVRADMSTRAHRLPLPSHPFTPQRSAVLAPPSHLEFARVLRACCRIQLLAGLQDAAVQDGVGLSTIWSPRDVERLTKLQPGHYRLPMVSDPEQLETRTVADFLSNNRLSLTSSPAVAGTDTAGSPLRTSRSWRLVVGEASSPHSSTGIGGNELATVSRKLRLVSRGIRFGTGPLRSSPSTPVPGMPFEPFLQYGLAIWDEPRLAAMGLYCPPGESYLQWESNLFFAWLSILNPSQIDLLV